MYNTLLQLLQSSPVIHNPQIIDLKIYGWNAFRVKIRAIVMPALSFQVWLNHNPSHTRYSYQLFRADKALLRWDNAPHHPQIIASFPHHFHDDQGQTSASPLHGDPLQDLPIVLAEIEKYVSASC
jgi:hypothetical protein